MSDADRARVLLALLVQGPFPSDLEVLASAARLKDGRHEVDLLVLDNRNLGPGWTDALKETCAEQEAEYYQPPRPLGLSRSMNLILGFAAERGYDHLLVTEVDAILPANLVDALVACAESDPTIASVSAWSEDFSPFGDPLPSPGNALRAETGQVAPNVFNQGTVDWVASVLESSFADETLRLPHAGSTCLLIPTSRGSQPGRLDPIYRRGNLGLIDWSLRRRQGGAHHVLAPTTFVCRWEPDPQPVPRPPRPARDDTGEALIEQRFPRFPAELDEFQRTGTLTGLAQRARFRIVLEAAARWGYQLTATWLTRHREQDQSVELLLQPDGDGRHARCEYLGFVIDLEVDPEAMIGSLQDQIGSAPSGVVLYDSGGVSQQLIREASERRVTLIDECTYPERV